MKLRTGLLAISLALSAVGAYAQQTAPAAKTSAPAPQPWTYKVKQLSKAELDTWLAKPSQVVFLDVRRPDELSSRGAFPAYLNIQFKELEKNLDYIPKDRTIITVSNRAHRAGDAGDLLTAKGFKVAGAAGTLDYEDAGGTVARVQAPPPRTAGTNAPAAPSTTN